MGSGHCSRLCETYENRVLQRHEIAEQQNIPVEFLEQILLALKRAGLLASGVVFVAGTR